MNVFEFMDLHPFLSIVMITIIGHYTGGAIVDAVTALSRRGK